MSLQPFTHHKGIAAPLLQANIDTDAIIPSREMKLVSKKGLGEGLFAAWRYKLPGSREINPDFILNQPAYNNTSILLGGPNFGCGSSREHAVWALVEYGIRAIIAPGFGSIFYNNCIANGLLPIVLAESAVSSLAETCKSAPQRDRIAIDLHNQSVTSPRGEVFTFEIAPDARDMLLNGLDSIGATLQKTAAIDAFEEKDRTRRSWAYL
ncbi:3-isopropylmalate/(R)-2-methylmalate dehydratase small subunit [Litorivivens lipolytica]|uniref:3-isopropylmalate dehydratase small subunit n=1 Tax=Litorivivens lipolytica TaxID=1524264 RepID=A0A7W4Z517_9GAMM|nr:3-isopropylmalate dehydratase small subunit [Litorivivens lipolytica]MBB3047044.1 3-isopropylmalate/(R)-2-methylmalate dehydratase small subunit [Litorivivens lipolytica]